jgi:Calx-beta domain-containing protein
VRLLKTRACRLRELFMIALADQDWVEQPSDSLSVNSATADGTAVAGTDYVSTSQTVTSSPGMTAQTVTVPLLNPGATAKRSTLHCPLQVGRSMDRAGIGHVLAAGQAINVR